MCNYIVKLCSDGGIGRHKGLKIPWAYARAGSSPVLSIFLGERLDTSHKKIYLWLWLACVFGSLSVLPYAISLKMIPETVGWIPLVIATAIQSLIINGVALGLAYYIVPKTDLNPFDRQGFLKNDLFFGAVLGCGIVFLIFLLEKLVFFGLCAGWYKNFFLVWFVSIHNSQILFTIDELKILPIK